MAVRKIPKKTVMVLEPRRQLLVYKDKYSQKRVAAYCRVSTDNAEQLTSYENQKKFYTEMIARNTEWSMAGIYADEGISGTRADKRPEFNRMIKDCLSGKIDYIITKSVSRFARNTVDCLDYVRMLKAQNIGIFFEEQNIDTLKSDSELYLIIYAGFAQSESESISKNITWSYRKNFQEGKYSLPYHRILGYRRGEDGEPEIIPEEAAVVERIFELFLAGQTFRQIGDIVRAEFDPKACRFELGKSEIGRILQNEKYCGDSILQKTVTIDCISKRRKNNEGEAPMYLVENDHPAIISREMFNRVQEEIARRRARKPHAQKNATTQTGKYTVKYPLRDVLVCAECGSRFRRCTWTAYKNEKRIVWRCINRLEYGKRYCQHSPTLDEKALQDAVARAVNRFISEDEASYLALMKATIVEAIGLDGDGKEIDLLERRIDALNQRMLALVNESVQSGEEVKDYEEEFKDIADEIEQLKRRIAAIRESACQDQDKRERMEKIQKMMESKSSAPIVYDDAIVRQMIECIKVFDDKRLLIIFGGGYEVEETVANR